MSVTGTDVVILCGGKGTRVQHIYPELPKCLFPFEGKPFLDSVLDFYFSQGFKRFVLCIGSRGDKIREHYKKHPFSRYIVFSQEPSPLGTAGALKFARKHIQSDPFLVANGDSLCSIDLRQFIDYKDVGIIAIQKADDRSDAGNISIFPFTYFIAAFPFSLISSFSEKVGKPQYINAGVYCLRKTIFRYIKKKKCSLEYDVFPLLTAKRLLFGFPVSRNFIDMGTEERYKALIDK